MRATVASILQIGISQNKKCDNVVGFINPVTYGTAQFKLDTRVYHTHVFAIDFCV